MPAPTPPIRDTWDNEPLRGIGGYMEFMWPNAPTYLQSLGERLHIRQWQVWHEYTNVKLPESGANGSSSFYRVADHFTFAAAVDIDLVPVRIHGPTRLKQPFYDGRLEGHWENSFRIALLFQLGDPTFFTNPELQSIARIEAPRARDGVNYRCDKAMLDRVYIINSAQGKDVPGAVVTCMVTGSGSALHRFVGDDWTGAGAFSRVRAKYGIRPTNLGAFGLAADA